MASVRQWPSGRWQLIVYVGRSELSGKDLYERQTVDAKDRDDAQRQSNEWEEKLHSGQLTPGAGGTVAQLLDERLEQKTVKESMAPSSLRTTRLIADTYLRHSIGRHDVNAVTTQMIDRFYTQLRRHGGRCTHQPCRRPSNCGQDGHPKQCRRKSCIAAWTCPTHDGRCATWTPCEKSPCEHGSPLSVASVARIHVEVRAALAQAVIWGWRRDGQNPAEHADPGRVITEENEVPEDADIVRLLAAAEAKDPHLADYFALAMEAGQRRGATHATRWAYWSGPLCPTCHTMVDRADERYRCLRCGALDAVISHIRFPKVISIGPHGPVEIPATKRKNTARKKITIGPHVTERLVRLHDWMFERARSAGAVLPKNAYVFSNDVLGAKPWRPEHTSRRFKQVTQVVNLDDKTQLRHFRDLMATQLLSAGVSPKIVGDRGGWGKLATMLDRYVHALPADDQHAAGIVDRIIHPRYPT